MTARCEWHHAPVACVEDFERFEEVSGVEFLARKKKVDFRLLVEAWRVAFWRVPHVFGGGQMEKPA